MDGVDGGDMFMGVDGVEEGDILMGVDGVDILLGACSGFVGFGFGELVQSEFCLSRDFVSRKCGMEALVYSISTGNDMLI